MNSIQVPISVGELIDKITILRIKQKKISDPSKKVHITKELDALVSCCESVKINLTDSLVEKLEKINLKLWVIEDDIREKERSKTFDQGFIDLARAVYQINDERFEVKKALNQAYQSEYHEEKSYRPYK